MSVPLSCSIHRQAALLHNVSNLFPYIVSPWPSPLPEMECSYEPHREMLRDTEAAALAS